MLEPAAPPQRRPRGDLAGPDGRPVETFRRVSIDDALALLETVVGVTLGKAFPNTVCR